jgi:hypothetical protein
MKKTAALLLFLQIFLSCNGQETKITYVQKLEYELKGAVKEVTTYIYPLENDKIPANNGNYIGKITMTLDSLGNVITKNKVWDFDRTASTKIDNAEFTSHFFGKGKELSFKETTRSGDGDVNEVEYKYVWLDDYNYTILPPNDDTYSITTTLNKEYQIIKCVYKKGNSIQSTEEWQTISKNNKIQEIKTKATENQKGKKTVSYQIQVVQEYDKHGNPTVIYGYQDLNKQKVKNVLYKEYKYYE